MICQRCGQLLKTYSKKLCDNCRSMQIVKGKYMEKLEIENHIRTPYTKEIDAGGAFRLIAAVVSHAFNPNKIRNRAIARRFADSQLLQIWCDCSENFEAGKIRKKILEFNKS